MKKILITDLGVLEYDKSLQIQESKFNSIIRQKILNRDSDIKTKTQSELIFVEHPHVYTLGKSGNESNLLISNKILLEKGATFFKTNRGGDITYHGPGQIVGYPIIDLDNFFTDIHLYLRKLENIVIQTIAEFGLKGELSDGETGVWLDVGKPSARKICAMGIKTSRWVTMHGFALNVNTDLSYFNHIIPCGIKEKFVTSIQAELGKSIDINEVKKIIIFYFEKEFDVKSQFI